MLITTNFVMLFMNPVKSGMKGRGRGTLPSWSEFTRGKAFNLWLQLIWFAGEDLPKTASWNYAISLVEVATVNYHFILETSGKLPGTSWLYINREFDDSSIDIIYRVALLQWALGGKVMTGLIRLISDLQLPFSQGVEWVAIFGGGFVANKQLKDGSLWYSKHMLVTWAAWGGGGIQVVMNLKVTWQ